MECQWHEQKLHITCMETTPRFLTLRDIVKGQSFEVFFPKKHVNHHPDRENNWEEVTVYSLSKRGCHTSIPVLGFPFLWRAYAMSPILTVLRKSSMTRNIHLKPSPKQAGQMGVVNPTSYPSFKRSFYQGNDWEQLVFGFYFSPLCRQKCLKLETQKVEYNPKFPHKFCTRTFKVKEEYCPFDCKNGWCYPDNPFLPPGMDMDNLIDYRQ